MNEWEERLKEQLEQMNNVELVDYLSLVSCYFTGAERAFLRTQSTGDYPSRGNQQDD